MSWTMYPYPTLFGPVTLEVHRVRLDGHTLDHGMISHAQQAIALHDVGRDDWREGEVEVRVTLPESEIADGPWSELGCAALLSEGTTNTRAVRRLTRHRESGTWQGAIPIQRSRYKDRATLTAGVVATIGGVPGRMIGRSDKEWVIDFEARAPMREQAIEIVQVDFREGPHDWLRPYKDAPWLIETNGETPTVYLNSAFEGLANLVSRVGTSLERSAAALVNAQIVSETWTAMFHSAIGDLEPDDQGRPEFPGGWRGAVLRAMLPDIMPEMSPADAVIELYSRRENGYGWADVQSRIVYAAGRRAQLPKHLTTVVRTLSRAQGGGGR